MARRDEISSTERLLGMIRDNSREEVMENPPALHKNKGNNRRFGNHLGKRKNVSVGIDFGSNELRLVKVRHFSEDQKKLVGYKKIPFDPQAPWGSPDFYRFLRPALDDFCGSPGKTELWCALPSARIAIRRLLIPKIPKKQIANAVLWGLRKEIQFDVDKTVFDYNILGDSSKEDSNRTEVIAWTALKEEVRYYRDLFYNKCGYPLTGLSLAPFSIQNLIQNKVIRIKDNVIGSLFVGREYSRIDILESGHLVLTRRIKNAIISMIECIMDAFNAGNEGEESPAGNVSGTGLPIDHKQAERILFSVSSDAVPLVEGEAGFGLEKADIYKMIVPALRRLVRQVERSFKNYSTNSKNAAVSRLLLAGTINSFDRVADYVGSQTGLPYEKIDPLASGRYIIDKIPDPDSSKGRSSFVHAAGMAVSEYDRTPNLLFTYEDKERTINIKRTNLGIFAVFFVLISICMGFFLWQGYAKGIKESKLANLRSALEKYSPRVDHSYMMQLSAKASMKQQTLKEYSKRYMGLAVIGEISRITTPNIRLLSIRVDLGGIVTEKNSKKSSDKKNEKKTDKRSGKKVVLDGIVLGGDKHLESYLAEYLLRLENSPVFSSPVVLSRTRGYYDDKEALQFKVNVELI
ncbi:hypothetical protein ACFL2O_04520 [Thermodesulfobacteriota bacterium]